MTREELIRGIRAMESGEICVICGEPIIGYGNNPAPISYEGRCCDMCDSFVVIPERMRRVMMGKSARGYDEL